MNSMPFQIKSFDHGGVMLNLSGKRYFDECVIEKVTAADSSIDLIDIFPVDALCSMAECVEAQLEREARAHNAEARAEQHQWHREFAIAA